MMNRRWWSLLSLMAGLSCAAGCGQSPRAAYDEIELVHVSGTITLDGQPLPEAVITFDAPDGQFAYGMSDSAGRYELQHDSDMQGVTPGHKVVRISTSRRILGLNTDSESPAAEEGGDETAAGSQAPAERVPPRYNDKSELTADVSAEQTEFDFQLSSKE